MDNRTRSRIENDIKMTSGEIAEAKSEIARYENLKKQMPWVAKRGIEQYERVLSRRKKHLRELQEKLKEK